MGRFAAAERMLRERGYEVANPTRFWACRCYGVLERCFGAEAAYVLTMLWCLWRLWRCDYIYKIPGWMYSRGAKIESGWAYYFGVGQLPPSVVVALDKGMRQAEGTGTAANAAGTTAGNAGIEDAANEGHGGEARNGVEAGMAAGRGTAANAAGTAATGTTAGASPRMIAKTIAAAVAMMTGMIAAVMGVVILSMILTGCRSVRQEVIIREDTVVKTVRERDSIIVRDSIVEQQRGDTVRVERWHTRWRDRTLHDTVYVAKKDSGMVRERGGGREGGREAEGDDRAGKPHGTLTWWQRVRMDVGGFALLAAALAVAVAVMRRSSWFSRWP